MKYGQLSCKRPLLVQDRVVAYENNEKKHNVGLKKKKKDITSSAKIKQIQTVLFDFIFSPATIFGKSTVECNCQCILLIKII